jgi:hypothetical protein
LKIICHRDGPTPSSTLHQKQLLKRPWYSDNITRTTGIKGEVTSLSGADKREVRDNREKW